MDEEKPSQSVRIRHEVIPIIFARDAATQQSTPSYKLAQILLASRHTPMFILRQSLDCPAAHFVSLTSWLLRPIINILGSGILLSCPKSVFAKSFAFAIFDPHLQIRQFKQSAAEPKFIFLHLFCRFSQPAVVQIAMMDTFRTSSRRSWSISNLR